MQQDIVNQDVTHFRWSNFMWCFAPVFLITGLRLERKIQKDFHSCIFAPGISDGQPHFLGICPSSCLFRGKHLDS